MSLAYLWEVEKKNALEKHHIHLEGADRNELVGDASVRLAVVHGDLGGAAMRDVLRQFHKVKCRVGDP